MASRFGLKYKGEDGKEHEPYIIHRAPLGTHERFIAFLIEHFGGAFPTWMAPVQVRLIPVAEAFVDYAYEIQQMLHRQGFRVQLDDSNDSFGKKIRNAVTKKIPNMLILGEKEQQSRSITWRRYCKKEQISLGLDDYISLLKRMRDQRFMDNFEDLDLPQD